MPIVVKILRKKLLFDSVTTLSKYERSYLTLYDQKAFAALVKAIKYMSKTQDAATYNNSSVLSKYVKIVSAMTDYLLYMVMVSVSCMSNFAVRTLASKYFCNNFYY